MGVGPSRPLVRERALPTWALDPSRPRTNPAALQLRPTGHGAHSPAAKAWQAGLKQAQQRAGPMAALREGNTCQQGLRNISDQNSCFKGDSEEGVAGGLANAEHVCPRGHAADTCPLTLVSSLSPLHGYTLRTAICEC